MPWPRCGGASLRDRGGVQRARALETITTIKPVSETLLSASVLSSLSTWPHQPTPGLRHEGMGASPDRQAARARPAHLALVNDDKGPGREGGALLFLDRLLYGRDLATSGGVSQSTHGNITADLCVPAPAYLFSPLQLQGEVGPSHRLEGDLHGAALAFHRALNFLPAAAGAQPGSLTTAPCKTASTLLP